jgi:type IV pilus assembly protein PilE
MWRTPRRSATPGRRAAANRPPARGFTLIEVLVVLAIAAVLAAIALPRYQEQVRRGRRAEARTALLQAAHWLEQVATASGHYPQDVAQFPVALQQVPSRSYDIGYRPDDRQGSGYTLTALPRDAQAGDKCGGYTFDHTGLRGLLSPSASDDLKAECWNR